MSLARGGICVLIRSPISCPLWVFRSHGYRLTACRDSWPHGQLQLRLCVGGQCFMKGHISVLSGGQSLGGIVSLQAFQTNTTTSRNVIVPIGTVTYHLPRLRGLPVLLVPEYVRYDAVLLGSVLRQHEALHKRAHRVSASRQLSRHLPPQVNNNNNNSNRDRLHT